ncbi:YeiH family protein [Geminicoccus roseus]|uniref:YeiH family protein n=1 Tax=Geminicoccus roseus TaxID=404900 RepID=UPI000421405C|nr:putative sulfate exporter family transporter [Geminicoccus roseus]
MRCRSPADMAILLPGLAWCAGVAAVALLVERAELHLAGRAWLDGLVLAILLGMAVRSLVRPGPACAAGIAFGAKPVLEAAIVLLGASVSSAALVAAGPLLILGIAGVVLASLLASYGIGRMAGLGHRPAMLVACGNSICGNSAIAAAAPVLGAEGDEVASAIALTAVLGVLVVLGLPLLAPLLGLSPAQYGIFAGLTVYAVPQVVVATAPVSVLSVQLGTLVKLVRVLMLGPVVLGLALSRGTTAGRPPLHRMVPWFITGFLAMMLLRSLGWIPAAALAPMAQMADILTVTAMAALGLMVDVRAVAGASGRVALAVVLSLLTLAAISLGLLRLLAIS